MSAQVLVNLKADHFAVQQGADGHYLSYKGERYSGPHPALFCEQMSEALNSAWQLGFTCGAQGLLADLGQMAKQAIG